MVEIHPQSFSEYCYSPYKRSPIKSPRDEWGDWGRAYRDRDSFLDPADDPELIRLSGFISAGRGYPARPSFWWFFPIRDVSSIFPAVANSPPLPMDAAHALTGELFGDGLFLLSRANSKFPSLIEGRVGETAELLVRYGISTVGAFRTKGETARRFPSGDLRRGVYVARKTLPSSIWRSISRWRATFLQWPEGVGEEPSFCRAGYTAGITSLLPQAVDFIVAFSGSGNGELRTSRDGDCGAE